MRWLGARTKRKGWLAIGLGPNRGCYVHGRTEDGGKPRIDLYGERSLELGGPERLAKEMSFSRYQCSTLLQPGQYQLLQVEAPNVPAPERKAALRWRLKDMLDYPVEEATLDTLEVPQDAGPAGRPATVYAVVARKKTISECIEQFQEARIPLSVIDIPELAQRNIATLYENEGRAVALLHPLQDACLLTINFRTELLLARRIEFGTRHFSGSQRERDEAFERVALEVQRTFDLLDRQYPQVSLSRVLVSPMPEDAGLVSYLKQNLGVPLEPLDLSQAFAFEGGVPEPGLQWRLFHFFGAALRH
jgi:MSHA biogenesis protein MshI